MSVALPVMPASVPAPLAPPRRVLLLANAKSRSGDRTDLVIDALTGAGLFVTRIEPQRRSDITGYIKAHAHEADAIIAAGGDGTMNAVIDGVIATGLPLGVMPMGTANDLARTLGLPLDDLDACARVIATGRRRAIDVGVVNGETFFNVASVGLSAELAQRMTPERKKRFGKLAYAITAFHVLLTARPFRATIRTREGEQTVKTMQIAIGNGLYYGGGNAVQEAATIDDGHLDLYSLEVSDVWKLALMARSFRAGKHGMWSEVRTDKCIDYEIITRKPMPVNADGEILTQTPAKFSIRQQALSVFVQGGT
ncbi:MAG: lipid kinase [Beijerinckiaceae bacterium]